MADTAITPDLKHYILEKEFQSHIDIATNVKDRLITVEWNRNGPYSMISSNTPVPFVNRVIGPMTDTLFDYLPEIEKWYAKREKPIIIGYFPSDTSISTMNNLIDRGYRIGSYLSYWVLPLVSFEPTNFSNCEKIGKELESTFIEIGLNAVENDPDDPFYPISKELFRQYCELDTAENYLYYHDSVPVGTGAVHYVDDVAFLINGAVLPSYRGQRIQQKLVKARLSDAKSRGSRYAVVYTDLESTSGRNMERLGFHKAFTMSHLSKQTD